MRFLNDIILVPITTMANTIVKRVRADRTVRNGDVQHNGN
jgi:hypothetical protein